MPYARAEVKLKHLPLCFLTFIRLALRNQAKEQINVVGPILSTTCLLATDFQNYFFPPHNPWISKIFYHHHHLAEVCISRRKPVHRSQNRERKIQRLGMCRSTQKSPPLALLTDSCNTHGLPALLMKHQTTHSLPSDPTHNARCWTWGIRKGVFSFFQQNSMCKKWLKPFFMHKGYAPAPKHRASNTKVP